MRVFLLSCVIIAFLMSGQTLALTCNPGSYVGMLFSVLDHYRPFIGKLQGNDACLPCGVGYFCANGITQEKCAFNTYSSGSAISCTACRNSNRGTDAANSACLLPNTPANAIEFTKTITVDSTKLISTFTKLNLAGYDYVDVRIKQTPLNPNVPITNIKVYGHRSTGFPGPGKYDGFENSKEPFLSYDNDSSGDILYLSIYAHPDTMLTIDLQRVKNGQ